MSRITVVLAEDHAMVRAGMRALLERIPDCVVLAEAADGREVLDLVARHRPSLVLMDISMPGLNGLDATAKIVREWPGARILILSMHAGGEYVARALRAGAAGYLLKGADDAELELAVRAVARGETYLSPGVSGHVVSGFLDPGRTGDEDPLAVLTPRQREVLQLVAEGSTTKEVASRLGLSVKTVETHRAQLMARLGIGDLAGLVRFAIRVGLVSPQQ